MSETDSSNDVRQDSARRGDIAVVDGTDRVVADEERGEYRFIHERVDETVTVVCTVETVYRSAGNGASEVTSQWGWK